MKLSNHYLFIIAYAVIYLYTVAAAVRDKLDNHKTCKVLALEGGGDKGSFEVGALQAFVELLKPEEIVYDAVTGVSVGAINAVAIALHEKGKEKECVDWMHGLWSTITKSDIYIDWPYGILEGLIFKEGIFDNSPEKEFLKSKFDMFPDKKLHRMLDINTCDIDTGEFVVFEDGMDWDSIPGNVVASTSMPFAFPHMHIGNHSYIDGGTIWNLDFSTGIERCLEKGFKESDIELDVIMCSASQIVEKNDTDTYNTIGNYMRYRDIQSFYNDMSDLNETIRLYRDVKFRYLVYPEEPLPSGFIPLYFNHDDMMQMIKQGHDQAKKVIEEGEGTSFGRVSQVLNDLYGASVNGIKQREKVDHVIT